MRKLSVALIVACCGLVATGARAVSAKLEPKKKVATQPGESTALAPAAVIASIDGKPVLYSEIEGTVAMLVRQAEGEYRAKVYELRRGALDQLLLNRLLEGEAREKGKSVQQWMQEDFLPSVPEPSEAELREAYDAGPWKLAGQSFEQARPALTERLRQEQGKRRFTALLAELMPKHQVKVTLAPPEPVRIEVAATGPARGDPKAAVTVVEFADFQCPYSRDAAALLARLVQEYGGKVRVVFRQFPVDAHPQARRAAEASLCAAEQGKFWELHDRMFADQGKLGKDDLRATAREAGLDADRLDACVQGGAKAAAVAADVTAGELAGVQGTPSFFVNGIFLAGAVPYEQLKAVIDAELVRATRLAAGSGR
jgi:protein-disulfide isomerase